MGTGEQEKSGPDLAAGVPLSALEEGHPLLGHVADDAVILVRSGEEVFGVGASCTHYGGPLAAGLVTGEVVRCPWHHACFSLRTGEAVAAPALNALPRWRTEVRDDVVVVTGREAEPAVRRTRSGPASVVIIGAGAAGHAAAETLRREGYAGRVVAIDPDPDAPYDRPNLSKDYLAGDAPEEWIPLRPPEFYAEHGIERVVKRVASIDGAQRTVTLDDGTIVGYGALLMATGAVPIRPPIPGATQPHVHVLRSLADCRALMSAAMSAQRAVIAGASFIGLEAAAALRNWGIDVTVVAPEPVPFEKSLGRELGAAVRAVHEEHGVRFRLGRTLREIGLHEVALDNDDVVAADLVLLGVGVRPVLDLAGAAGLVVQDGVLVNRLLETSQPGVYAAGDIARYPDPLTGQLIRIEHWVVAQRQGQTAARNILGHDEAFTAVPFFWTRHYDLTVRYVGHASSWTDVDIDGSPADGDRRVTFRDGTRTLAVATIDRDRESLQAEVALERAIARTGPAVGFDRVSETPRMDKV
jgi:apoptosis-inducing factor 3